MSQKIYTNLDIKGNATIGDIINATSDTDKFLVSDAGVVKYRTGSEMLSDLGVAPGVASNVQHQVKAGVAINKGQAVYVTSADGTNMIVGLASNASEATSSKTMGLLDNTVAANGFANVVTEGLLSGLNTIGSNAGDPVWLGTSGNLIYGLANKPSAPAHLVFIGIVTRVNANNGEIFIKAQNGFELNEIHDVDLKSTPASGNDILAYEGAPVNLWKNKSIAAVLGYTPYNASNPAGYISSYTETDPTVPSHVKSITTTEKSNWNTAFGWGNHASAGYALSGHTHIISPVAESSVSPNGISIQAGPGSSNTQGWTHPYGTKLSAITGAGRSFEIMSTTYPDGQLVLRTLGSGGTWDSWKTVLDSNNYSTYVPTLTGGNASGTWPISITGNADTVDNLHASDFVRAYSTSNDNIDSDWGQSFKTFDPIPSGTPPIASPNLRTINIGENYSRRTQLSFDYAANRAWFRRRADSTWSAWSEFIHSDNISSFAVPSSRTITINGTSYDLSANRSWTVSAAETDTLATVTGRGATTSVRPSFDGGITVNGQSYVTANGYFVSGINGFRWNDSSGLYNNVIMRDNGTTWFRNYLETPDSMRSPIYYDYNDITYFADFANTGKSIKIGGFLETYNSANKAVLVGNWNGANYWGFGSDGAHTMKIDMVSADSSTFMGATDVNLMLGNRTVLHTSNYSSYALPLSGGTMAGQMVTPSFGTGVYDGGIQLRETGYVLATQYDWGYAPAITFHWGNRFAKKFGARSDGQFAVDDVPIVLANGGTWSINIAGNASTVGSATINTLRGNVGANPVNFTVNGDANTYYPVIISPGGQYGFNRYSIYRGYAEAAPWDPIGTGVHKGGLTFTFDWSSDIAWGGNDKAYRVIEFQENYTTMVAGMTLPVTGGMIVWLRGGGAAYHLQGPAGINHDVSVYYSGYTAANGSFFGTRTNLASVDGEIMARYPIRGNGDGPMYINNSKVLYEGSWINSKYFGTDGNIYAAKFSDSDDGNYYVEPGALSKLWNLELIGSKHTYLYINPGTGYEAMLRVQGGSGSSWYAGKRTTGTTQAGTDGFHFYSDAGGDTVVGFGTDGTIRGKGDVVAYSSSDRQLKDNVTPIKNALEKVNKIGGYTFDWNDKQNIYEGHDVGVIAQEIEKVLPEVVTTRDTGYKAVKYEKIVPLLIEAIKEQQTQIEELKELINKLISK